MGNHQSGLRRFLAYYAPHLPLFVIDMTAAIASALLAVIFPYLTRDLLKIHIPQKDIAVIIRIFFLMGGIYIVKAGLNYVRTKWGHYLGVYMEYDMRDDLFRHLQKLSFNYFDNVKTGHIMSRISNDLNTIAEVAHHAPEDFLISIFVMLGAFTFMFLFNTSLALVALIPIPLMLIWGLTYGRRMKEGFRQVRRRIADINSTVENSVQGIREVKSYAMEDEEISKFNLSNTSFKQAKKNMYGIMAIFLAGMHILRDYYYLIVIGGGVWLIIESQIQVADLLAFILYLGIILPPIDRLISFVEQFQRGAASFERFTEIMDIEPDIQDRRGAYSLNGNVGHIEFCDVSFRYLSSPDLILSGLNFKIDGGERVAVVGESGAGKSTLVSLIPRFYEVDNGEIKLEGHDILDLKQQYLRECIGIVQQNVFLFDGTIRENIMYGRTDAREEDLIHAARMANIYGFVAGLPDGFDTEVGERGVKLSGGQKQRVSIARVFLKNPPILIFDEATSSLDTESEGLIQEAMFKLSENRTTIIIAHRLSTVRHVDRIFVLKEGRIVEEGNHDNLVEAGGHYHNLYSRNLF